ncbi:MAG: NAD(P)/FAD-dependent oxidoreductase [Candidatus Binatus sp.]|uniref:flavin-containing monooxygenase n=1 Tax=Candidatus Binatus sp. TaxID=2811406 RepID=UPI0027293DCC|nr:NAD(P)/FAD-dependent oxidoreductase [Candidatus Binatus sp.]MDO8433359.1 NAD(P)/FAD-dependent oxidoreductase [Candidatus Binatus sp.]
MSGQSQPVRRIAIIGSGFSGLCLGIQLKKAGISSFTIFEKSDRLGGTWRDNTYPGAACDVPSFSYCFSFEQKTDWSRKWSPQSEILDYMEHCARKYEILPHLRFGTEIASARWDEDAMLWHIRTTQGEELEAEILVSGVGQLNRPHTPKIQGIETYRGVAFHSARWRHDVDLTGKSVGVIGNAASAIQFIPQIAPKAAKVFVFQRSANWMVPRNDLAYSEQQRRRYARHPWLAKLYRWKIWLQHEINWPVFRRNTFLAGRMQQAAENYMRSTVKDPELQAVLIPDYPIGGKRILISDDYFPTLNRENVEVVISGIDHLSEGAVNTKDGRAIPVDAVILATGFESTAFLAPMSIRGRNGRLLRDEWKGGARAYLGISVAGFPNLFLMYGPNTNLGHNSIIFMIECQTNYILDCLRKMDERGASVIDLKRESMDEFDARVQHELQTTVWASTGKSWYKTSDGRITNNWSGSTIRYWWNTRHANPGTYRFEAREASRSAAGSDSSAHRAA